MAIDGQGRQMVTAGADGQVKVWDVRKFQAMHAYFSHAPAECLDISQRGLLAVGYGRNVQVTPQRSLHTKPSCHCWRQVQHGGFGLFGRNCGTVASLDSVRAAACRPDVLTRCFQRS